MSRTLRPLTAYPSQLRALSSRAVTDPSIFPLSIGYPTSTQAMEFRVLFYTYRRTLRAQLLLDPLSPSLLIEAQGAELIQSPRISPSPDNGDLYNCTFRLASSTPHQVTGLSALDLLLAASPASPEEHKDQPAPAAPAAHKEQPASSIITHEPAPVTLATYRTTSYSIPTHLIPEDIRDLPPSAIGAMLANGLLDLPHSPQHYSI